MCHPSEARIAEGQVARLQRSDDIRLFPSPSKLSLDLAVSFYFFSNTPSTANVKPLAQLSILLVGIISAFAMNSIFQKLTRPFSSATMRFAPDQAAQTTMQVPEGAETAILAAGCFWGIEHMYRKDFGNKGLLDARVGYIGGNTESPSYRAVCSGSTGREFSSFGWWRREKSLLIYSHRC